MCQYPAAALCTELVNRVGESSRSGVAKASHRAWQLAESPVDDVNTVASVLASSCAMAQAWSATNTAALTTLPARRRSLAGNRAGGLSKVGLVSQSSGLRNKWLPVDQSTKPGPNKPTPATPTFKRAFMAQRQKSNRHCCHQNRRNCWPQFARAVPGVCSRNWPANGGRDCAHSGPQERHHGAGPAA